MGGNSLNRYETLPGKTGTLLNQQSLQTARIP